jgi:hypothetical protein
MVVGADVAALWRSNETMIWRTVEAIAANALLTTRRGGACHTVSSAKPISAMPESLGALTDIVPTGLQEAASKRPTTAASTPRITVAPTRACESCPRTAGFQAVDVAEGDATRTSNGRIHAAAL